MRQSRFAGLVRLSLFAAAFACAPTVPKTGVNAGRDPLVIASDEIDPVRYAYVMEVIKQARPNWLTMNSALGSGIKRAQGFAVYEGNVRVGGLETLSGIPTSEVASIRFLDTYRAAALPGMGSDVVLGAIVLTMKH